MIVVGRAIVDEDTERMFILLSYSSALRLTVLTKRSCAYTLYVHSGKHRHGAAYKHMLHGLTA